MKSSLDKEALVGSRITGLLHSENWIGCAREEGLEGEEMLASEVDIKANILQEVHVLEWWHDQRKDCFQELEELRGLVWDECLW